ncbi:MAG: hypothetical protein ACT4OO_00115 [Nitrospiraceae bacterium]
MRLLQMAAVVNGAEMKIEIKRDDILAWARTMPSLPGWYWYRESLYGQLRCLRVFRTADNTMTVTILRTDEKECAVVSVDTLNGEWAGPAGTLETTF